MGEELNEEKLITNIFSGPPVNYEKDFEVVETFIKAKGKKVICGGTTAMIVSRILNESIEVDINTLTKEIPPIAKINGIDLVTEGVLTLKKTLKHINAYKVDKNNCMKTEKFVLDNNDGASKLSNLLISNSEEINFFIGKAQNPAHKKIELHKKVGNKLDIIIDIAKLLKDIGKEVNITYVG